MNLLPLLSDPTVNQVLLGLGSLALGWFLRHQGVLAPSPAPTPVAPSNPAPVTPAPANPILSTLEQELLNLLKQVLASKQTAAAADLKAALQAALEKK
jgi:hypothetical protein